MLHEEERCKALRLLGEIQAAEQLRRAGQAGERRGTRPLFVTRRADRKNLCVGRSWDEAGLGNENIDYTLTADSTAVYACINNGGQHPKASNKESVNGAVSTGGSFQARNGRVKASLTAGPLTDPSFTCPSGQTRILAKVTYSNIVLTDTTHNVAANPADVCRSFSSLFPC